VLLRNLTNPGEIIDDAGIGRTRSADNSGDVADIGIGIERGIQRVSGQPMVRGQSPPGRPSPTGAAC
jgi:hypothetical protein